MPRYIKRRKRGWYFILDVPVHLRRHFAGRSRIEETLSTRDEALAAAKAQKRAGAYRLQFLALEGNRLASEELGRGAYEAAAAAVVSGDVCGDRGGDPEECARDEIGGVLDANITGRLSVEEEARIAGLMDGVDRLSGRVPRHGRRFEPKFKELAERWLAQWKGRPGRKPSNTAMQYESTIRLFDEFWGGRPIREVRARDAAEFTELLKRLPPTHGRGALRGVPLAEAIERGGGGPGGLSSAAIRRHLGVLKQVWEWAKPLGYAVGDNPFQQVKVPKEKVQTYLAWPTSELKRLLADPPKRRDIYEAFHIAMYTGLRVGEVADMDWSQVRDEGGIAFIQVEDAKTEAGHRRVPLHPALAWLEQARGGRTSGPVFPGFNPEGPGKRRGADASRLFGAWKRGRGISSRRYVFHSARKNVTAIMEEKAVPSNQWARIIGHEPGFTYGVYNPHGLSLAKAQEIIGLIEYPHVALKQPNAIYGTAGRLKRVRP